MRLITAEEPNPSDSVTARPDRPPASSTGCVPSARGYTFTVETHDPIQLDLIATLNEVAEAVSSAHEGRGGPRHHRRPSEDASPTPTRRCSYSPTSMTIISTSTRWSCAGGASSTLQDWWEPHLEHLGREAVQDWGRRSSRSTRSDAAWLLSSRTYSRPAPSGMHLRDQQQRSTRSRDAAGRLPPGPLGLRRLSDRERPIRRAEPLRTARERARPHRT